MTSTLVITRYTINTIRNEACELVASGTIGRNQPIYALCQYIPAREWDSVEQELEDYGYLLRDRIIDLLYSESWTSD
jgi:hypothetical protein